MSRRRIVVKEALAYLRTAAYASSATATLGLEGGRASAPGLFLVHGVGATPGQFKHLAAALAPDVAFVDHFDYRSTRPLDEIIGALVAAISRRSTSHEPGVVVVGHSLGGLLLRIILQSDHPPPRVRAFVSICAPLGGTTRCALAPSKDLRSITPGAELFVRLANTEHRLEALRGRVLAVGSWRDHFVEPKESAFLSGARALELHDAGHVASLFDRRVHEAVRALVFEAERATD
ncbi:MAG: alpha/beta fold hydrolase [Deltaproteobacteria bacterium]|nr:alpha/beta fold hydrolase [Deltaproteobacteria bacterium]